MTFSGQDPRQRRVEDTDAFTAIVSGGLNTYGNRLLMSGDDSPDLYNVEVAESGSLLKRKGLKVEFPFTADSVIGSIVVPWRSASGRQFFICKLGTVLQIMLKDPTGAWKNSRLVNRFPTQMATKRPAHVVFTHVGVTRIVYVHGDMVPIQLSVLETTASSTLAAPGVTFRVALDDRYQSSVTSNAHFILINGEYRDVVSAVVFSGTTWDITVSGSNFSAGTYSIELFSFSTQWWAEGLKLTGNQIIDQQVQNTTTKHVPIPEKIRQNINEITLGLYPIRVYSATTYGSYFSRFANLMPTTATEYTFSIGVDSAPNPHVPSANWVTFGATPGAIRTVTFARYHLIPFGSNSDANLIRVIGRYGSRPTVGLSWVFSGSVPVAEGGVGTGGARFSYGFCDISGGTLTTITSGTQTITPYDYVIRFDQTSTANGGISIPQDDIYSVVASDPDYLVSRGYLGSFATSTVACAASNNLYGDTFAFPIYGIWEGSNYETGSFPSTISLIQNRIAIGGFPEDPMHILISSVGDSSVVGEFFNNFQIFYEDGLDSDPLDVQIPGRGDDIVLALREFQGSLFAFTRYNVIRVAGNDGIITPTSFFTALISSLGCVNPLSVTSSKDTVYFFNTQGVFSIKPTDDVGGYSIVESTRKIKNLFRDRPYIEFTSFLEFDPEKDRLFLGTSDEFSSTWANQLFVYQIDRDAWTIWTDSSGDTFQASHVGIPSILSGINTPVFLVKQDSVGALVSVDNDLFCDQLFVTTGSSSKPAGFKKVVTHTTVADVVEYYTTQSGGSPNSINNFRMCPIGNYQDCVVTLSGQTLEFGVDYIKTDRSSIILTTPVSAGLTLKIYFKWKFESGLYDPVAVFENNRWIEPTLYSINETSTEYTLVWDKGYSPSGSYSVCNIYPAYHITPVFTRSRISSHKRQFHYYGYYDNTVAGKPLKSSEVSTTELIGTRRHNIDFDMAFIFNSETWSASTSFEVYGFETLHWDYGIIEFGSPEYGQKEFSRTVVPIIGAGYGFQVAHISFGVGTFQLVGYEIRTRSRRSRGYSRVD